MCAGNRRSNTVALSHLDGRAIRGRLKRLLLGHFARQQIGVLKALNKMPLSSFVQCPQTRSRKTVLGGKQLRGSLSNQSLHGSCDDEMRLARLTLNFTNSQTFLNQQIKPLLVAADVPQCNSSRSESMRFLLLLALQHILLSSNTLDCSNFALSRHLARHLAGHHRLAWFPAWRLLGLHSGTAPICCFAARSDNFSILFRHVSCWVFVGMCPPLSVVNFDAI